MRISTHPGQYIVLSSIREDVVAAAIAELDYHDRLLSAFGLGHSHKIVLHLGAGVADQRSAYDRFAAGYARLSPGAARRLVLENDERWPLDTTLDWANRLGLPVVFDAFHHELAPSMEPLAVRELVLRAAETWTPRDGRQEVHFSTQAAGKRPGAHAETIDIDAFARFAEKVGELPLDCILEVKDKERSVLRARELALPIAAKGPCESRTELRSSASRSASRR
jgi:UV DNA damage endonuclease